MRCRHLFWPTLYMGVVHVFMRRWRAAKSAKIQCKCAVAFGGYRNTAAVWVLRGLVCFVVPAVHALMHCMLYYTLVSGTSFIRRVVFLKHNVMLYRT